MSKRYNERSTKIPGKAVTGQADSALVPGFLDVNVIFTDDRPTSAALSFARSLARELGARVCLLAAIAVPFELPLDHPQISVAFMQERLRRLASDPQDEAYRTSVHLYLCRDRAQALLQALKPNSLVIIPGRRNWWPSPEKRLAHALRSGGHQVILLDSKNRSGCECPAATR